MATKQDLQQKVYKRFVDAIDLIAHKGFSINQATKQVGMSKNTFRAMNKERGNLVSDVYDLEKRTKTGKSKFLRHEVDDRFAYVQNMPALVFDANGEPTTITGNFDKVYAGILGKYWHEIANLEQGKNATFSAFPDVIYDRDAKAYRLVKDQNTLYLFLQMQNDQYMSEIWKRFHSEKRKAA